MFGVHYKSMPLYTRDKYIEIAMYTRRLQRGTCRSVAYLVIIIIIV